MLETSFVRYIGKKLLRAIILFYTILAARNSLNNKETFNIAWKACRENKLVHFFISYQINPFQSNTYLLIYVQLRRVLRKRLGFIITPELYFSDQFILGDILSFKNSALIVHMHDEYDNTIKIFSETGRKIMTISRNSDLSRRHFQLMGVVDSSKISIIPPDSKSIVKLLGASRRGDLLICTIDFTNPKNGQFEFISKSLFKFSKRYKIPLYFVRYEFTEDAEYCGFIEGPITNHDATQSAHEFINFVSQDKTTKKYCSLKHFVGPLREDVFPIVCTGKDRGVSQ